LETVCIMSRGDQHTVEPFELRLAQMSRKFYRDTGRAVTTTWLSDILSMSPSTMRWWLRRAERHGVLCRTSERGGWLTPEHAKAVWTPDRYMPAWAKRTKQRGLPLMAEVARVDAKPVRGGRKRVDETADAPVQLALVFAA
jgi:DNA-binding transcriptional ArsR family regulator